MALLNYSVLRKTLARKQYIKWFNRRIRALKMISLSQDPKGEPWSPETFVVEPGTQSLSLRGARTKKLFLAKWSPGAPNFPSWSPGTL